MSKKTVIILAVAWLIAAAVVVVPPFFFSYSTPDGWVLTYDVYSYLTTPLVAALTETLIGAAFRIKPAWVVFTVASAANIILTISILIVQFVANETYTVSLIIMAAVMAALKYPLFIGVLPEEKTKFRKLRLLLFAILASASGSAVFYIVNLCQWMPWT